MCIEIYVEELFMLKEIFAKKMTGFFVQKIIKNFLDQYCLDFLQDRASSYRNIPPADGLIFYLLFLSFEMMIFGPNAKDTQDIQPNLVNKNKKRVKRGKEKV